MCYYEHTKMTMSVKIHYRYMFNSVKLIVIDILHLQKLLSAHPTISKRISVGFLSHGYRLKDTFYE